MCCLEQIERDLVKEGEKLSDMLSMPVKNAMGVVLNVDYEADIVNVSEILEMTKARCQLFCDSVELQRLTLQQVSYVLNYETDASQVSSMIYIGNIGSLDQLWCIKLYILGTTCNNISIVNQFLWEVTIV